MSKSKFETELRNLLGKQRYQQWIRSGRVNQAYRVVQQYPTSLGSYVGYKFKEADSRIDEYGAIEHLLEFPRKRPFFCITRLVDQRKLPEHEKAVNEFVSLLRLMYDLENVKEWRYDKFCWTREFVKHRKIETAPRLQTDRAIYKFVSRHHGAEFRDFYMALYESTDNIIKAMKERPQYPGQATIIDDLLRLDTGGITGYFSHKSNIDWRIREMSEGQDSIKPEKVMKRIKAEVFRKLTDMSLNEARMLLCGIIGSAEQQQRHDLAAYARELEQRLASQASDKACIGIHQCFLDDLVDNIKLCVSGHGIEREASLAYALDEYVHIISMDRFLDQKRVGTIGKMILVECRDVEREDKRERPEHVLLVDGAIISSQVEKYPSFDWQKGMYDAMLFFANLKRLPKIIVNVSHGTAQQSVHDFVRYVADMRGFVLGQDYSFDESPNGVRVFRPCRGGRMEAVMKTRQDGFRYTHRLRKDPLSEGLIEQLSSGGWNGQQFLDSFYLCDAYPHLLKIKQEHGLALSDPEDILDHVKGHPSLAEKLSALDLSWTSADGYVTGIEIDPLEMYLEKEPMFADEIRSLVRHPPLVRPHDDSWWSDHEDPEGPSDDDISDGNDDDMRYGDDDPEPF